TVATCEAAVSRLDRSHRGSRRPPRLRGADHATPDAAAVPPPARHHLGRPDSAGRPATREDVSPVGSAGPVRRGTRPAGLPYPGVNPGSYQRPHRLRTRCGRSAAHRRCTRHRAPALTRTTQTAVPAELLQRERNPDGVEPPGAI